MTKLARVYLAEDHLNHLIALLEDEVDAIDSAIQSYPLIRSSSEAAREFMDLNYEKSFANGVLESLKTVTLEEAV